MPTFYQGLSKLASPSCCFLGIAAIGAAVYLTFVLNYPGVWGESLVWPSKNIGERAKIFAAMPKTTIKGKILELGIEYTGACDFKKMHSSNVTVGDCDVSESESGAVCSTATSNIFDEMTAQQLPKRRLGYGLAMSRCVNSYQPWLKVEITHKGLRCAYRFGLQELSEVDGSDASRSIIDHIFDGRTVGSEANLWSIDFSLDDTATCVVGFSDEDLILSSISKKAHTEKATIILLVVALALIAAVLLPFGVWAMFPETLPATNYEYHSTHMSEIR